MTICTRCRHCEIIAARGVLEDDFMCHRPAIHRCHNAELIPIDYITGKRDDYRLCSEINVDGKCKGFAFGKWVTQCGRTE